jgi:hypothetical protein
METNRFRHRRAVGLGEEPGRHILVAIVEVLVKVDFAMAVEEVAQVVEQGGGN